MRCDGKWIHIVTATKDIDRDEQRTICYNLCGEGKSRFCDNKRALCEVAEFNGECVGKVASQAKRVIGDMRSMH